MDNRYTGTITFTAAGFAVVADDVRSIGPRRHFIHCLEKRLPGREKLELMLLPMDRRQESRLI